MILQAIPDPVGLKVTLVPENGYIVFVDDEVILNPFRPIPPSYLGLRYHIVLP